MKRNTIRLVAAALLVTAVVACQSGAQPLGGAVAIRTAPAVAQACMDALLVGTLAVNGRSGLGVTGADGHSTAVEWPFGYTARNDLGTTVLVDETGNVVAKVGDEISLGGGFGNELWHACRGVTVTNEAR